MSVLVSNSLHFNYINYLIVIRFLNQILYLEYMRNIKVSDIRLNLTLDVLKQFASKTRLSFIP